MRKLIAIVVALASLVACGPPPLEEGYVRNREFIPEHWESGWETYYTSEYQCHSESTYNYQTKQYESREVCGTESVSHQRYEDHHEWIKDQWRIKLEACGLDKAGERKCRSSWRWVTEEVYESYDIGEHYPNPK